MTKKATTKPVKQDGKTKAAGVKKKGGWFGLSTEEKLSYGVLALTGLVVVMIRTKFLNIPFERDEGAYGYYGKLLLEGGIPYKDFYEQKFPGLFYFYAFMVGVFGDTVKGLHQGFMLVNLATIVLLFFASKRMFSPAAGAITAITYAIVSMAPNLSGFTVQGEHGVALFISLGIFIYSFTISKPRYVTFFLMGIALGCAFMTKTSGVFLTLWGGLVILTDHFLQKGKFEFLPLLKRGLVYTAGVLFVIGVLFLIISIKGSFKEMIYWAYENPQRYVNKIKWEDGRQYLQYNLTSITTDYKFFWLHAFAGLLVVLFKNVSLRLKFMGVMLIFLSCVTIFPGFYFYGHYWIQILPGLSILSGLTYFILSDFLKSRLGTKAGRIPAVYLSVFIFVTLFHLSKKKDYYFNPNYDIILRNVYGVNPFPETMNIANYINANSKPGDGVVAIGSEPQLYFYTGMKCPSRHAYFATLVDNSPEHRQFQDEFIRNVEEAMPRYFVFYNHSVSLLVQPNTDQHIFEWSNKFVGSNYNLIGIVDMIGGYTSKYIWGNDVNTYKPESQYVIYVFEKKT